MRIFVSINGVLRNFVEKFDYHYHDYFLNRETEEEENFKYDILKPIKNNELLNSYLFQDINEFNNFLFIDFPIEIFGHARVSYQNVVVDLNNLIYENNYDVTVVGLNELGKAKPATLFFLSKNGFLGKNIKFIYEEEIKETWELCDVWITDDIDIIKMCPKHKKAIKFNTKYNQHYKHEVEIDKITDIKEKKICLKSLVNITTLISMLLSKCALLINMKKTVRNK